MKRGTWCGVVMAALLAACGSSDATTNGGDVDDGGGGGSSGGADAGTQPSKDAGGGSDAIAPSDSGQGSDGAATGDGAAGPRDPNADGPYAIAEKDAQVTVPSTNDTVAIHAAYPNAAGSFPVVVMAHGFQLAPSQYYGYVRRLATFGYVALTVDFPTNFLGNDNPKEAADLVYSIDWAKGDATIGPVADATRAGMSGHSLGGKLALLAATKDPRVKASIVLDPVDGGNGGCNAPQCVTVADLLPTLNVPTGFLGETTDASGGFQPCAPAAQNFTTFYAKATSPSFEVTIKGANHMSFLDDVASCGITCSFCQAATSPNAQVNGMARAYLVAFYERWLRGDASYDTYLTGALATARYVTTGQATIANK